MKKERSQIQSKTCSKSQPISNFCLLVSNPPLIITPLKQTLYTNIQWNADSLGKSRSLLFWTAQLTAVPSLSYCSFWFEISSLSFLSFFNSFNSFYFPLDSAISMYFLGLNIRETSCFKIRKTPICGKNKVLTIHVGFTGNSYFTYKRCYFLFSLLGCFGFGFWF